MFFLVGLEKLVNFTVLPVLQQAHCSNANRVLLLYIMYAPIGAGAYIMKIQRHWVNEHVDTGLALLLQPNWSHLLGWLALVSGLLLLSSNVDCL